MKNRFKIKEKNIKIRIECRIIAKIWKKKIPKKNQRKKKEIDCAEFRLRFLSEIKEMSFLLMAVNYLSNE